MSIVARATLLAVLVASPAITSAQSDETPDRPAEERTEQDPDAAAAEQGGSATFVDRRTSSGLGFQLSLGGLAALRSMSFSGSEREIKHAPNPYLGGAIRGSQHLWTFETKSHLLVEAEAGFGSAKNADPEPAIGRPLTTEHTYLSAMGVFEKPLTSKFDLRLGLGAGLLSFTVEPNPRYTGHRYLTLVTHFGAVQWLDGPFRVGGGITFFPGLDTNQSAGDYGAARAFGGRGELFGTMRFFQPEAGDLFGTAEVTAQYSLTRFRTTMPETQAVGEQAGTDDTQHVLLLMLSYYL